VARGTVRVKGNELKAGGGAAVSQENLLTIAGAAEKSEVLLLDLA
jgi:redox-sensitive bicupin YhaK (pirin superfamily)